MPEGGEIPAQCDVEAVVEFKPASVVVVSRIECGQQGRREGLREYGVPRTVRGIREETLSVL